MHVFFFYLVVRHSLLVKVFLIYLHATIYLFFWPNFPFKPILGTFKDLVPLNLCPFKHCNKCTCNPNPCVSFLIKVSVSLDRRANITEGPHHIWWLRRWDRFYLSSTTPPPGDWDQPVPVPHQNVLVPVHFWWLKRWNSIFPIAYKPTSERLQRLWRDLQQL